MGNITSSAYQLTKPITLNRIRMACQKDSHLPYSVKKLEVQLLANDLNKVGFKVPIKDAKGHDVAVEDMCKHITDAVPKVDNVCMINDKNRGNVVEGLRKLANHFNRHYGSNILLYKNKFGPKNKENMRAVEDICDDLYMVEDRIRRSLSDHTQFVKSRLHDALVMLAKQKEVLDNGFNTYLSGLRSNQQLDEVQRKAIEAQVLRERMLAEMDSQLNRGRQDYANIVSQYQGKVNPLLGMAEVQLDNYARNPFSASQGPNYIRGVEINKIDPLFKSWASLAPAAQLCRKSMSTFGGPNGQILTFSTGLANRMKELMMSTPAGPQQQLIMQMYKLITSDQEFGTKCQRIMAEENNSGKLIKDAMSNERQQMQTQVASQINQVLGQALPQPTLINRGAAMNQPMCDKEIETIKGETGIAAVDCTLSGAPVSTFTMMEPIVQFGGDKRRKSSKRKNTKRRKSSKSKNTKRKSAKGKSKRRSSKRKSK